MARRRAARTDDNQTRIVNALRRAGVTVRIMSEVGGGFPDLIALHRKTGAIMMLEVKDGDKPASARKLTALEEKFAAVWPVHVVNDEVEALRACGINVEEG